VSALGSGAVTQREVDISKQLVEALASEWDPSRFADEYREELLGMIAERTPTQIEEPVEPSEEAGSRIKDLMDTLRRSVEEAKARPRPKAKPNGGQRAG
jgi:DNA end-binding protein Ku